MARTLAELGEFGLIASVTAGLPALPDGWIGPGDDAAVLRVGATDLVLTCDLLVENRHFRRSWSSAGDVGHKAAAQSLADVAAMGAEPTALLVGFAAPGDLPVAWAEECQAALAEEASRGGAFVVGGDVVSADSIVLSVTALGRVTDAGAVLRSGARQGDVVALSGPVGMSAAGLAVLGRGFTAPRQAVAAHRRPMPDYAAGPAAARSGAHALIDVSDGLLADLGHVALASGVVIDLDPAQLPIPASVQAVAAALGRSEALSFVLTGGEDHALAGCFAPGSVPEGWLVVGTVAQPGAEPPAVTVGGEPYEGGQGHQHFR
jgi:thiamine-monophosphate kinase